MTLPRSVERLIQILSDHFDHYKSTSYNETQLRREFLDPLFKALGWDIDNEAGYASLYKDVVHEDAIKIGGSTKAPDYCFRIGGTRKFFLEAKKPSASIKDSIPAAYQLRRYAWSAKLALSILSDFEEFSVYDTRVRPFPTDKSSTARVFYCTFDEYHEKWEEIASIFSRESVLKGSFDKYADAAKKNRGTAEVDDAFLEEIERWRELLAKNIAFRNAGLSERDLNFAIQKIIDRIIFLRICEDRGTEDYGRLRELRAGSNTYESMRDYFIEADARYNSGLFHFKDEHGYQSEPDRLTLDIRIDDKPLKDILRNLYYPESPYEFSVLPADILGQVYERFLGKTISLSPGHKAKIEEKPEVRKAGGVYYTPTYIAEYIVENTLGSLLNGTNKSLPSPITVSKAAELKILDPACGSGSFLIVAYQYLLDWHQARYIENADHHARGKNPKIYQSSGGEYRLTTKERKRILINNIFGVDIDPQAVEVTKLSLLLKILEGETEQIVQRDWVKQRERILPDLGKNIHCGNSLVEPDFYRNKQAQLLDQDARIKINALDWQSTFLETMARGGFDCVIGNPPYVRQEGLKELKDYFSEKYLAASGTADLYVYFLEKAVRLLRDNGRASYVVSSSFLKTNFGKPLRRTLKEHAAVTQITDFGGLPVFERAKDTYVCVPQFQKTKQPAKIVIRRIDSLNPIERDEQLYAAGYKVPHARFSEAEWSLRTDAEDRLFNRLLNDFPPLGETGVSLRYGIKTGFNEAFVLSNVEREEIISEDKRSAEIIFPLRGGRDCRRYLIEPKNEWLIFTRRGTDISHYPAIERHLQQWKEDLTPKTSRTQKRGRKPGRYKWFEIQDDVVYWKVFTRPKIIFPDICRFPRFCIDEENLFLTNTGYAIDSNDKYLLGFLNSRLFWWLIGQISIPFGTRAGEFRYRLIAQYMNRVPVKVIDPKHKSDKKKKDQVVDLVDRMLKLKQELSDEKNPQTGKFLGAQITSIDFDIEKLISDLFELTDDEIMLIEEKSFRTPKR